MGNIVTPAPALIDVEEFWDDLLAFIEDRRVIPVAGMDLLTIEDAGKTVPLYRAVAERLLKRYNLTGATVRDNHELNDAVSALVAVNRRVKDLYRPVNDILHQLLTTVTQPPPVLCELAAIRHFDLFVTATPDDLLVRAINKVRFNGAALTTEIEYAPKLPTERRRDIPEVPNSNYAAVFYLFGKTDVAPFYAIHDEDALEFPYTLQAGNGPERMFSEMRSRNLLLIGCGFPDWLSRFFLRLSNSERLSSDQRTKKEFLVDDASASDRDFATFLERFSQDSRTYSSDARAFVTELHRRWSERNPSLDAQVPALAAQPGATAAASTGNIFISYAGEDLGAAKALFGDLQAIGGDVAWFDKSALKPGDDWHQHISSAVQRCSIFIPLISANTESRTEGYFRLEWSEAAERSRRIQGRKFIFPVVIDKDYGGDMGRYTLVPDVFKAFQYSHAPAGTMNDTLRSEITEQLRNLRRARPV
jgi:TIR domain